jgi:hypothetical protein
VNKYEIIEVPKTEMSVLTSFPRKKSSKPKLMNKHAIYLLVEKIPKKQDRDK